MERSSRSAGDLLEIVRVLLTVQGAILLATTIEAAVWSVPFAGGALATSMPSAVATLAVFVARVRVRDDRRWARRTLYAVEGVILATLAMDAALAMAITRSLPPAVALLTRLVLPVAIIILLKRSSNPPAGRTGVAAAEGAS